MKGKPVPLPPPKPGTIQQGGQNPEEDDFYECGMFSLELVFFTCVIFAFPWVLHGTIMDRATVILRNAGSC